MYLGGEIDNLQEYSVIRFNYDQLKFEKIEVNFLNPIKGLLFDNNDDMIIETQYSIIQNEDLSESQRNAMIRNRILSHNRSSRDRVKNMSSFYRLNSR